MTNRALLVGIDEYPNPANNLNSCVKDTYAFRDLLSEYEFTDSDVQFLHDSDATLASVGAGLDWLLDGAEPGDRRVFFESSHGYRYLKDGVLVEVLCLYDEFLEDAELSERTENIPDGVLTVVLDACHSGGMDKIFAVGNESRLLRMKVYQPSPEEQREKAFAVASIAESTIPVKFFGRALSANARKLSKNFTTELVPGPAAKGVTGPDVELNAVLLTACRADETAAAGSEITDGLSAFTYALKAQLDQTITVSTLCDRTVSRLRGIGMDQTPSVFAPSDQQFLLSDTFISEQPVTEPTDWWEELFGSGSAAVGATKSGGFEMSAGSIPTKTKEHTPMTTTLAPDVHGTIESVLGSIAKSAGAAPSAGAGTGVGAGKKDLYMADVAMCAANLVPALVAAAQTPTASKAPTAPRALNDPTRLRDKGFWDDVWDVAESVVQTAGPIVLEALLKGYTPQKAPQIGQSLAGKISPERLQNKDFWSSAFSALETIIPQLIDVASGRKAYSDGIALNIPPQYAQQKGWFDDVMSVVQVAAPLILMAL